MTELFSYNRTAAAIDIAIEQANAYILPTNVQVKLNFRDAGQLVSNQHIATMLVDAYNTTSRGSYHTAVSSLFCIVSDIFCFCCSEHLVTKCFRCSQYYGKCNLQMYLFLLDIYSLFDICHL